jgi:rare lipoprotein A
MPASSMHGARSSVDRVLASEARGRWFDPSRARHRSPPVSHPRLSRTGAAAALLAALVLAGCATPPGGAPGRSRPLPPGADGPPLPGSDAPDPLTVPDAEPKLEPIRIGGPNKPYEVLGKSYTPVTGDDPLVERGLASWYGRKFHGRRTASGEVYNMHAMTAAHKTMPIPSYARVRNPANGREVVVRVNDRGPFSKGRVIDLSYAAAVRLGVHRGVAPVEVERITYEDIRAGLATRAPVMAQAEVVPSPGTTRRPPVSPPPDAAAAAAVPVQAAMPAPAADAPAEPPLAAAPTATTGASLASADAASDDPVREGTERARAHTRAASGFWLQLGAFGQGGGAYSFQQRVAQELDWLGPLLTIFAEGGLHRLQAGPYASREQAREAGERVRAALALVPVIVERR